MGWRLRATVTLLMSFSLCPLAQRTSTTPKPAVCDPDSLGANPGLEVVSDLGGVDFTKYFADVLITVRKTWPSVIPIEARPPAMKKGCSAIEFSISRDGHIGSMMLTASSGDEQLDQASWLAISKSVPFSALPSGYVRSDVVVRFHFYYNPDRRAGAAVSESTRARTSVIASMIPSKGRTTSPRGLYTPLPSYPERAIQDERRGTVLISLIVSKKGDVGHVQVVEGIDHDLDREACKAIKTWKFQPETKDGKATEVPLNVKVTFNLK